MKYDIRIETEKRTLVDIDRFYIKPGTVTLLLGESGIGKSLISKAIVGLLSSEDLNISFNDLPYINYKNSPTCSDIQEKGFFVFQYVQSCAIIY